VHLGRGLDAVSLPKAASELSNSEHAGRYLVLNKNGSANALETASRNFDPFAIFDELKYGLISQ
jgi:hypothetical protein